MSTLLEFGTDIGGRNAYAPQPCTNLYSATLTNGVATSFTLPANSKHWIVAFTYQPGVSVWVDFTGATAAIPVGNTLATTTSELNPASRFLNTFANNGTTQKTISVITENATADISVALYALPTGQ